MCAPCSQEIDSVDCTWSLDSLNPSGSSRDLYNAPFFSSQVLIKARGFRLGSLTETHTHTESPVSAEGSVEKNRTVGGGS